MAQVRESGQQQASQQASRGLQGRAINVAAMTVRGFSQIYDMQAATARMVLQAQARVATTFGLPDYSDFFRVADERAKRVFSDSTERVLHTAQQATDTLGDVNREVGRLWESQTVNLAEALQRGLEEFEAQTAESLTQLKEFAQQQAEEVLQATQSFGEAARETMREGSEQVRETVRQGLERSREIVGEQAEAVRGATERVAEEAATAARRGKAA